MERTSKQVLVVRKDLNMRKGKIAAQCAHASMKVILDTMERESKTSRLLFLKEGTAMRDWIEGIFTKVCVSVNSEAELLDLRDKAKAAGILHAIIQDAGKTEFHGVPTYTVVAIGPAWSDEIDPITGHLPLL